MVGVKDSNVRKLCEVNVLCWFVCVFVHSGFTVCSEIHTKHTNTLCGQNVELLNVKHGGTYTDHWTLNGQCFCYDSFIAKSAACNRTFPNRQETSSGCKSLRPRLWQGVLTHGQMNRKLTEWQKKPIVCVYLASTAVAANGPSHNKSRVSSTARHASSSGSCVICFLFCIPGVVQEGRLTDHSHHHQRRYKIRF
jgi:hypothetical protein